MMRHEDKCWFSTWPGKEVKVRCARRKSRNVKLTCFTHTQDFIRKEEHSSSNLRKHKVSGEYNARDIKQVEVNDWKRLKARCFFSSSMLSFHVHGLVAVNPFNFRWTLCAGYSLVIDISFPVLPSFPL